MQLESITLHNIRSYTNAQISFPSGITLLSGDIGSGKSTILLAIEFALFGLLRGELSGNALLRNGTNHGSVELAFTVGGTKHAIQRTLKRTKDSVEQDSGNLFTNGIKKEATATELKSAILELLGYPPELLTKSKNRLFRYTIYTPQEEMKKILHDSREERIATLRKVFDIEKYERITQNSSSYTKALRERKRALDMLTSDMAEKKKQAENAKKELAETEESIRAASGQLENAKTRLAIARQKLETAEQERRRSELITREMQVTQSLARAKDDQKRKLTDELMSVQEQLARAQKEIQITPDYTLIAKKSAELNQFLLEKDKQLRMEMMKIAELNTLKQQAHSSRNNIASLSQCPTCLQEVAQEHKHRIMTAEEQKMKTFEEQLQQRTTTARQTDQDIIALKRELEIVRLQENQIAIAQVKLRHQQELAKRKNAIESNCALLETEASSLKEKQALLEERSKPLAASLSSYDQHRAEAEKAAQEERQHSIHHSTLLQKEHYNRKTLAILEQEVERKEKARKQLEKTQHVHHWITDCFIPLMETIEKHVMAKIHHEFDALFQQWFGMLVEDLLGARIDETFTPIIQQNGYDIDFEHLSGGERTACALAYRLALNKTINSLISSIRTKDLLILDEPTDGFSAEQLDKMRDVLAQTALKQVVIVSHEQKIEGIADTVIRIRKEDHFTVV